MLSTLENNVNNIIIVSSGGGGAQYFFSQDLYSYCSGANGGGITGLVKYCESNFAINYLKDVSPASQISGGSSIYSNYIAIKGNFGQGSSQYSGGGAGFYGGTSNYGLSGSGSGYIGNAHLTNKAMYCYDCEESSEVSTKTISTSCVNEAAKSDCSKIGNGYARITLIR